MASVPTLPRPGDDVSLPLKSAPLVPKAMPAGPEEYHLGRVDGPLKCTWYPGMTDAEKAKSDPHKHIRRAGFAARGSISTSVLDCVGETPCVRLNRIPIEEGVEAEVVAKCEFFNAGGSVKDRIGKRMIEDAERSGRIKPGDTLIEPTSGNTGIGLALAAALKGYRMIITLPEKMSQEKVDVLKALGAEIIRTPTEAAWDAPDSHIGVAKRLNKEIPNSHILDQYSNPSNPLAHYDGTAEEIWEQCEGKVDMIVLSAGTGGTLTGTARRLKELNPQVIVVGVDPKGSILAPPEQVVCSTVGPAPPTYVVEGIGYDFIPAVLDRSIVDYWVKTDDTESFIFARRLIREEGLLCGGSSGSALAGAMKAAKSLKKGQRCVVLLPDSIRNYMSKHLNDDFLWRLGIVDPQHGIGLAEGSSALHGQWWARKTVADLGVSSPITVTTDITAAQAVELLTSNGIDQLPVVDDSNNVVGVVTEGNLTAKLMAGKIKASESVTKALFKQFRRVTVTTPLSELARAFDKDHFAVVVQTQRVYTAARASASGAPPAPAGLTEKQVVVGVVSRIDLLRYITANVANQSAGSTASPRASPSVHSTAAVDAFLPPLASQQNGFGASTSQSTV